MSHFTHLQTSLRHLPALCAALTDLGLEWQAGPAPVRGYQGQAQEAAVVVPQENGYDLGFAWNGTSYALVTDLQYWQQPLTVRGFLNEVTQRYAYHTVLGETTAQGFQIAEEQRQADGSIRLVLQRWAG